MTTANSSQVSTAEDLLHRVMQSKTIAVDFSCLAKGIDNYHVDVMLSENFVQRSQQLIEQVVGNVVVGAKVTSSNLTNSFRKSYVDMLEYNLASVENRFTAGADFDFAIRRD